MNQPDYYQVLGVSRTASIDDIKRAYRRLARQYHPDVSHEPNAEERFKSISEAYEVLHDPQKRQAYDQTFEQARPARPHAHSRWQSNTHSRRATNPNDIFNQWFKGAAEGNEYNFRSVGEDQEVRLELSLEEAYQGGQQSIQVQVTELDRLGRPVTRTKSLSVKIPAGVTEGQRIRLSGQGSKGAISDGDLYLNIHLKPHPLYQVQGRDVTLEVPITPWEAALGCAIEVPTLGGKVAVTVPANAQSGQKLRLRGRGLPGNPAGDHYVKVHIVNPPVHSESSRELFRRLARELPFNPREGLY